MASVLMNTFCLKQSCLLKYTRPANRPEPPHYALRGYRHFLLPAVPDGFRPSPFTVGCSSWGGIETLQLAGALVPLLCWQKHLDLVQTE